MPAALIGPPHFAISLSTKACRYSGVRRSGATRVTPSSCIRSLSAGVFIASIVASRFDRGIVELLDDGRGRALRHKEGVPGDGFETGEALLVRGGQRRQERRAAARQQRDAFERVARDLRERA